MTGGIGNRKPISNPTLQSSSLTVAGNEFHTITPQIRNPLISQTETTPAPSTTRTRLGRIGDSVCGAGTCIRNLAGSGIAQISAKWSALKNSFSKIQVCFFNGATKSDKSELTAFEGRIKKLASSSYTKTQSGKVVNYEQILEGVTKEFKCFLEKNSKEELIDFLRKNFSSYEIPLQKAIIEVLSDNNTSLFNETHHELVLDTIKELIKEIEEPTAIKTEGIYRQAGTPKTAWPIISNFFTSILNKNETTLKDTVTKFKEISIIDKANSLRTLVQGVGFIDSELYSKMELIINSKPDELTEQQKITFLKVLIQDIKPNSKFEILSTFIKHLQTVSKNAGTKENPLNKMSPNNLAIALVNRIFIGVPISNWECQVTIFESLITKYDNIFASPVTDNERSAYQEFLNLSCQNKPV